MWSCLETCRKWSRAWVTSFFQGKLDVDDHDKYFVHFRLYPWYLAIFCLQPSQYGLHLHSAFSRFTFGKWSSILWWWRFVWNWLSHYGIRYKSWPFLRWSIFPSLCYHHFTVSLCNILTLHLLIHDFFTDLGLYAITKNTEILFDVKIHGLIGFLAGLCVAIMAIMPNLLIARTPFGNFTNR